MTFGKLQVRPGMTVVDTRGADVGRIADVHDEEFVLERTDGTAVTLGYDAVRSLLGDQVVLDTGPDLDTGA